MSNLTANRRAVLRSFKGCYAGEDRAAYYKGSGEESAALQLVKEGKLVKSEKNADMGGNGDKRYTYFCPAFDTFDYKRSDGKGGWIEPDARMKLWR